MIRGKLVMEVGFDRPSGAAMDYLSFRRFGRWFVLGLSEEFVKCYQVLEYDEPGQRWLIGHEIELDPTA